MTLATRAEVVDRVDVARRALEAWLAAADERASMAAARAVGDVQRASAVLAGFAADRGIDDHGIAALDEARGALDQAATRLGDPDAAPLRAASDQLAIARRAALDLLAPVTSAAPRLPFAVGLGLPALHDAPVPDPRLVARDGAEDDAEDDDAFAPQAPAADEATRRARAQLGALARDCLEDVGIMGSLRHLWDHEAWTDGEGFEERLLAAVDALAALDRPLDPSAPRLELVAEAWRYATEWKVPDRGRSFALGFILACLASKVATVWLSLAIRRAHPAAAAAYAEAVALGSSPHLGALLEDLLLDDDPAVLTTALAAAARRGGVPAWIGVLVAHPDPAVAHAAIDAVATQERAVAEPALTASLDDPRLPVAAHAAAVLVHLGAPCPDLLRRAVDDPSSDPGARARAARALAVLGAEIDAERLVTAARGAPELAPWLGWHGAPGHVPVMLEILASLDASHLAHRIADALQRITGVTFEPPPVTDARSVFPALDVDGYRARLEARLREAPLPATRCRGGRPFDLDAVLDELVHPRTPQGHRRVLADELSAHTHGAARVDVETWIAAQRDALARIAGARPWRSGR